MPMYMVWPSFAVATVYPRGRLLIAPGNAHPTEQLQSPYFPSLKTNVGNYIVERAQQDCLRRPLR
jgi:hypothetical protein